MHFDTNDGEVFLLVERYIRRLDLPADDLWITSNKAIYESWLGRRVRSSVGGAYCYHSGSKRHLVLINLPRIDRSLAKSVEIVVAEELLHMRQWIDGDRRRHAKHGYDRVAFQVAELTGATLDEVRGCVIPTRRRALRYIYACPRCKIEIPRRRKGTWSCPRCAPAFDRRYVLQIVRNASGVAD